MSSSFYSCMLCFPYRDTLRCPLRAGLSCPPLAPAGGLTPPALLCPPIIISSLLSSSSELICLYLSWYSCCKFFSICRWDPKERRFFLKPIIICIFYRSSRSSLPTYSSTSLPDLSTSVMRLISSFSQLITSLTCRLCSSMSASSCVKMVPIKLLWSSYIYSRSWP